MQLTIETPFVKIDEKLWRLVMTRFLHIGKVYDRIIKCHVLLKQEKDGDVKYCGMEAEVVMPDRRLFAREQAECFEAALHQVADTLKRQLCRERRELY